MNTDLAERVYQIVKQVPKGQVTTYGKIAKELNMNPRWVGRILHKNQNPKEIPCHRVVRSDGSLATGYAFGGQGIQKAKLISEGVVFKKAKIDLGT